VEHAAADSVPLSEETQVAEDDDGRETETVGTADSSSAKEMKLTCGSQ
jgi:hypothetical protein